jgi:hypothetical protein
LWLAYAGIGIAGTFSMALILSTQPVWLQQTWYVLLALSSAAFWLSSAASAHLIVVGPARTPEETKQWERKATRANLRAAMLTGMTALAPNFALILK